MTCPRCGAPTPDEEKFCTGCGLELQTPPAHGEQPAPPPVVRLVTCPNCGASNAASRTTCGRCRAALHSSAAPTQTARAEPLPPPLPLPEAAAEPESSRVLLYVTLGAALVVAVVLITLLGARGVGLLAPPDDAGAPAGFTTAVVTGVTTSLPTGAEALIDGQPATVWRGALDEYVEFDLADEASVARLLLWNGYQDGEQFAQNGRVQTLLIDAGGRRFTVELLDARGSQAVDLPQPVRTRTVRLTVASVYEGDEFPDPALGEVELLTT